MHEMEARQAQKNLTATHKRQLEEMQGDLNRRRERNLEERDESYRKSRLKRREVARNLEKIHTDLSTVMSKKEELAKVVKRGMVTLQTARAEGLGWQVKYAEQQDQLKEREAGITFLERFCVVDKNRIIATFRRKGDDLAQKLNERDKEISSHGELWRQVCLYYVYLLFLSSN
jgi:hypothetical protein